MTDLIDKTLRLAAMTSLACLAPAAALAQTDTDAEALAASQFTVEVIVFRYADSVSAGTEVFVPEPPPEPVEGFDDVDSDDVRVFGDATTTGNDPVPIDAGGNPIQLDTDGNPIELDADGNPIVDVPPGADYILLLDDELTMLSTWDRLDRLDAYEPLAHFGWHQQLAPFDDPIGIPFADFGQAATGLDGELTLYVSRFLHLAVALELNANPDAAETDVPPSRAFSDDRYLEPLPADSYLPIDSFALPEGPTFYRIDEDRIFKSGDLRYFDHPRFGVIARVDRVELPEDDEPADASGVTGSAAQER